MRNRILLTAALIAALLFAFAGCAASQPERVYAASRAELMKALAEGEETVYVGDIEFDENDLYIEIRRSVKLIGRPGGSVLKKGTFLVAAPEPETNGLMRAILALRKSDFRRLLRYAGGRPVVFRFVCRYARRQNGQKLL